MALSLPNKLQNAIDQLGRIPGIGAKTALRQALQISNWDRQHIEDFAFALRSLGELVHCENCGMFCDDLICSVCSSHKRAESKVICVVESVTDCLAIEKSDKYFGLYHVLGGVFNPLLGIGPDELNFSKLISRVRDEEIKSLILAINPSVEGDATCAYIRQELPSSVSIERIGFGIPIGGSLEYVDSMTISKALENRKTM